MSRLIERVKGVIQRVRAGGLKGAIAAVRAALKGPPLDREREAAPPEQETGPERGAVPKRKAATPKRKGATPKRKAATPKRERAITGTAVSRPAPMIGGRYENAAGARRYKLFLPPQYRTRPLPLLVMLHGCRQDPEDFATGTRMNIAAAERGVVVLYPAQARAANLSRCWNWFNPGHQHRDAGEPLLLAGMTRDVIERHGIDRQRVYVAGLSAGASMAVILGEACPDLFAAVGVFAGMPTGAATGAKSALAAMKRGPDAVAPVSGALPPTIVFHGDADRTVHPRNGESIVERVVAAYGAIADPRPAVAANHSGADQGAGNHSAANPGVANPGVANPGGANPGGANPAADEQSTANERAANQSTVNESTVNESTVNESTVNESTVNESTVNESAANVSAVNESTADEQSAANESAAACIVYRDGRNRAVAEHWLLSGGGHAWCGGDPAGSYAAADGPDASAEMLRFFANHSLPSA
jgi:poly(hydroxyalkanoate) depolymerase family esterase